MGVLLWCSSFLSVFGSAYLQSWWRLQSKGLIIGLCHHHFHGWISQCGWVSFTFTVLLFHNLSSSNNMSNKNLIRMVKNQFSKSPWEGMHFPKLLEGHFQEDWFDFSPGLFEAYNSRLKNSASFTSWNMPLKKEET